MKILAVRGGGSRWDFQAGCGGFQALTEAQGERAARVKSPGWAGCDSGGRKYLAGNSLKHARARARERTPPAARTQEFGRKQQEDISLMIFISTFETGSHLSQTDLRLTL